MFLLSSGIRGELVAPSPSTPAEASTMLLEQVLDLSAGSSSGCIPFKIMLCEEPSFHWSVKGRKGELSHVPSPPHQTTN